MTVLHQAKIALVRVVVVVVVIVVVLVKEIAVVVIIAVAEMRLTYSITPVTCLYQGLLAQGNLSVPPLCIKLLKILPIMATVYSFSRQSTVIYQLSNYY